MQKSQINATPLGQYKATFIPSAWLTPKEETPLQEFQLPEDTDLDAELLLVLTTTEVEVSV